jgi:ABC-type transporter Mla subunit MlaD
VTSAVDWSPLILAIGVGVGVLLMGIGVFVACTRLGGLFTKAGTTLDGVDAQLALIGGPVAQTLSHVGGIADTADTTLAKLVTTVESLETVAANVNKTSTLAQEAIAPSIVNVGATLAGVTAALRKLVERDGPNSTGTTY